MTPSRRYPLLFSPLVVGPLTLENRIVFSAHRTNYAEDGLPTAQHAAYYEERAAGGAGLVITEEQSVHPTDWPHEKIIRGFSPEVVPAYRKITDKVHGHGTAILAQINHNGGQGTGLYSAWRSWRRPRWPTRSGARCRRRPKAMRSPRSSPVTRRWRRTAGGRLRRRRAAVLGLLDTGRLPLARHEPAHRLLRRLARAARPARLGGLERGARARWARAGDRGAPVRRRAHRPGYVARRRRGRRSDGGATGLCRLSQRLGRGHDGDALCARDTEGTYHRGTQASSPLRSARRSRSRSSAAPATGTRLRPNVRSVRATATSSG